MSGWIKLWRKTLKSQVFSNESLLRLWIWCLLRANHEDTWVDVPGLAQPVRVLRGQFITGRFSLHKALYPKKKKANPCAKTTWRWLETLGNMQNLSIQTSSRFSLITIGNYDNYQSRDGQNVQANVQPVSSPCPAGVQPVSTDKTVKKVKKVKKNNGALPPIPLLLDTPEFQVTWTAWQKHRSEIGKKLTPTSVDRLFGKFVQWGVGRAVVAIEHTIAQGWQGIREPEATAGDNGDGHPSRRDQILARLEREAAGKTEETR